MPGEASAAESFAPRVYIPLQDLPSDRSAQTRQRGALSGLREVRPENIDVEQRIAALAPHLPELRAEYDTVAKRKKDLGEALKIFTAYLIWSDSFRSLLGAVGVASAMQAHLQEKPKRAPSFVVSAPLRGARCCLFAASGGHGFGRRAGGAPSALCCNGFSRFFADVSSAHDSRQRSPGGPSFRGMSIGLGHLRVVRAAAAACASAVSRRCCPALADAGERRTAAFRFVTLVRLSS